MLFTKCILSVPSKIDGKRVSVMSRHTLNDGKTPDCRIRFFDVHLSVFAPSALLLGDYYRRSLSWVDFQTRYLDEIRTPFKSFCVRRFAHIARVIDVTILCIEPTTEHCHRRLLAEECQIHEPSLHVEHR